MYRFDDYHLVVGAALVRTPESKAALLDSLQVGWPTYRLRSAVIPASSNVILLTPTGTWTQKYRRSPGAGPADDLEADCRSQGHLRCGLLAPLGAGRPRLRALCRRRGWNRCHGRIRRRGMLHHRRRGRTASARGEHHHRRGCGPTERSSHSALHRLLPSLHQRPPPPWRAHPGK